MKNVKNSVYRSSCQEIKKQITNKLLKEASLRILKNSL